MKLSQIRTLSWSVAMCGVSACAFLTQAMIRDGLRQEQKNAQAWIPKPYESQKGNEASRLSDAQLDEALFIITNVPKPPPPPGTEDPNYTPPPQNLNLILKLIAFEKEGSECVSMAFFEHKVTKESSPFVEGEPLFDSGATLHKINEDTVVIRTREGKLIEMQRDKPDGAEVPSGPGQLHIERKGPPQQDPNNQILESPPQPGEVLPGQPPSPVIDKIKFRTAPKTRDVSTHPDWPEVEIVEYDSGDKDVKRFGISDKGKEILEAKQLQLFQEVTGEVMFDDTGKVMGIKVIFQKDNPLIKSYGVLEGDILSHIDDMPITSVEMAMEIYQNMQPKRRVKLQLIRNKSPMIIFFEMDDFPSVGPSNKP